jgi:glycine/D-amino acid oxidase-like deaminating enzyme
VLSYWEQTELVHADMIIVGAGITGLSIAASLLERSPSLNIKVLERSVIPYGASTRNAGFACFGSPTECLSDLYKTGEDAARNLVFQRWMGIQITRKRLKDEAIGYLPSGGFELVADNMECIEALPMLNDLVSDFIPGYFSLVNNKKPELGLIAEGDLIAIKDEGQVNSGMLMGALRKYVTELGAEIINGANVTSINRANEYHEVLINEHARPVMGFKSKSVVLATNAFVPELVPSINIQPGRGQVIMVEAPSHQLFKGNLHLEEGYYYLRNLGNYLLFGGGRNLDFSGERTKNMGINNEIHAALLAYLPRLFGERYRPKIIQSWSGIMGFTTTKHPLMQEVEKNLWVVAGLSGMGIALAGYLGEEFAEQWNS